MADALPLPGPRALGAAVRRRRSRPRLSAGLAGLIVVVGFCVVGPLVSPYSATDLDNDDSFAPASHSHWLGTDEVGRDLATRLMAGGRLSLTVAFGAVVIALVIGTVWGVAAASRRGLLDELLMRTADIAMAVPQILFALLCVAAFGASLVSLTLIVGILLAPSTARMARASVLVELELDYTAGAVAYGAGRLRLLVTEVLPNVAPALASQAVINASSAMILEASLSFVGLGVQPPSMSWGVLLQQGYGQFYSHPIYPIAPAVAILATVLFLNLLADRFSQQALVRSSR